MKFLKLFFAAVMLFFANNIWAYNFSAVHNGTTIYYNITNYQSPYTVEVTYRTTSYNSYSGSITIPDSVTYNGITYSVTSIGRLAFYGCTGLTSITIPNTVTSIGSEAFNDSCVNLTRTNYTGTIAQWCDIDFYDYNSNPVYYSRNIFINNQLITNLVIPNTVDTINKYAFCCDTCITSVTIPNPVKHIGDYVFAACTGISTLNFNPDSCTMGDRQIQSVFARCTNLRTLNIGNNVRLIPDYAFSETGLTSVTIGNSVKKIGNSAFSGCTGLTSVTIGNSVTSIGIDAFSGCTGLTSVTIPNSVTSIGVGAFSYCTGLTSVTIPNSVTSIGANAFYGCTGLTSVTIPNSVTSIGNYAFSGCTGLTSVTIPNSVTSIGNYAFSGCTNLSRTNYTGTIAQWCNIDFGNNYANPLSSSHNLYINNQLVNNLVIPNTVDTIKQYAFYGDTCITSVTIGDSVTSIGNHAFYGCTGLTSVTIGNSVTSIGANAFYGCTGLTSVTIPNSVTSIGQYAFYNCTSLTSVTIGNSVTRIGNGAFYYSGLTRTNYTGTIAQWCNINFGNYQANPILYSHNLYINNQLVTNLVIPNTVDTIKQYAFYGDTCITSVTIGDSVTSIGNHAFYGCTGLTSVTIGNSVTSIGNYAFSYCTRLTSITFRRANITIGNNNFNGLPAGLPIHIPCGSSAWYINKLPNFSNFIEELQYSYLVTSQDTVKGSVATITAPTCNSTSWTIRATANTGYTFSHWSDGDTNTQRTLTVNMDTTIVAHFVSVQPWYTFSVVSEDTLKGTVQIITQPSQANPQATFVAVPNTGYTFSRWSDGNTQNPRSITVTQDTALVAYFTGGSLPQWYRFSVVSEDTLKGTVQIVTQPSQTNPQATFVALPNTGYTFSRWSDGNTQNPRTLTVTQDTALVAYFTANTPQWYSFSVVSEDTLKGTVQIITQPSQANPQATFVAVPNTGYTFSRWSDGNTQNPRSITVTQDTILIAFFSSNQGIAKAESANITLYPNPASETVTITGIGNEANILVINAMGKVVRRYENVGGTVTFSVGVLPKGIYFVRMGNAVRKLVVE